MPAAADRLRPWEKAGLVLFGVLVAAFGVVTEIRSALLSFQHTDFNVYTHVGWAVRTGEDIYGAVATNGLHYTYPSFFSLLVVPFAAVPPWAAPDGFYLPYPVSVGVWYALSVGFLAAAVHLLAGAVLPGERAWGRRWWYARTVPVYVCLGGVGFSLGRGQVNLLIVAMTAAAFAAAVRGRRTAAGAWLGAAVVIKVIPAILFLFPFVRRDWRAGVGAALALAAGLWVIPVAVWGQDKVIAQHRFFVQNVILAGTTGSGDHPMGKDLTETTATDSQSFQAAFHHIRYAHLPRDARPVHASAGTRLAHTAISGVLVLATLLVGFRRLTPAPADQLVFLGCLCGVMMVASPVSHMHYYAFVLPLVAGLWLRGLALRPGAVTADARTTAALAAWGVLTAVPLFPGPVFERLRECGLGAAATVGLWALGLSVIGRPRAAAEAAPLPLPARRAA